jgi:tRNA-splicing ligase RtcB (3'-phosphate/5'-hydroxy nucleic acid ligase)
VLSRNSAMRSLNGKEIVQKLLDKGIIVKTGNISSIAEEASQAYKDVTEVIDVVHKAGLSQKVAMAIPIGVIKG